MQETLGHGIFWFDLEPGKTDHCYGWHRCCFSEAHEGDHMCIDGHFCPQMEGSNASQD